ncbi:MAG: hypothetical protein NZ750_00245 [Anaerolineae bacterium]|nr:hypothetical protein [Anaerolineae bacterium]MDW8171947.1 hypothetical protein [Anaerolineae bacterium]
MRTLKASGLPFLALKLSTPLLPALLVVGILHFRYGTNIYEHAPVWNDEVGYWHQAATFAAVGFQGGYYSYNENVARATWTRFDVHGPWYPMLYGTLGRLLGGWELYTGVLLNLILFSASTGIFVLTVQPSILQLITLGLVLASMHPVLLYLPSTMSEGMQASITMLLAAIFWRLLRQREQAKPWQLVAYGAFLWIVTVTRLSWGILLLPFFLLVFPFNVRGVGLALLMTALSSASAYLAMNWVTPQQAYHSVLLTLNAFGESWSAGIAALVERFLYNAGRYFDTSKSAIDLLLTVQTILVFLMTTLALVASLLLRNASRRMTFWIGASSRELSFHLYNLTAILVTSFFLYIIGTFGDYRVVGLHLLLTLVLLVMSDHFLSPLAFSAIFFMGLPFFFNASDYFMHYDGVHFGDHERVQQIQLPPELRYDPNASSPWCNTLVIDVSLYRDFLVAVPPGIGISWVLSFQDWQGETLRSRYVWMRGERAANEAFAAARQLSLRYLDDVPGGQLYLNEASACSD